MTAHTKTTPTTTLNVAKNAVEVAQQPHPKGEDSIRTAFLAAVKNEEGDENIKMNMLKEGARLNNVGRLFDKYSIEEGLAMTLAKKGETVQGVIDIRDILSKEGLAAALNDLVDTIPNTDLGKVTRFFRRYCKNNDIAFYKPKISHRRNVVEEAIAFLVANPEASTQELYSFINTDDKKASAALVVFCKKLMTKSDPVKA